MKTSARQIAERYVRALFEVTADEATRGKVEADLSELQEALSGSDVFRQMLKNPLLTREQLAEAMGAVLKNLKAQKLTIQFISLLAQQKRLELLPDIIAIFIEWAATARGELKAELTSAAPLKPAEVKAVEAQLSKAYGKKVMVNTHQNKAILGGMILSIGSVQLDSSLAGKLQRLAIQLKAA